MIEFIGSKNIDITHMQALLATAQLPTAGLEEKDSSFILAKDKSVLVAMVGLEPHGEIALLRSLVVKPEYRNRGLAKELLDRIQVFASQQGIRDLYLLTTTAADYFRKCGFTELGRQQVPDSIQASEEFSELCPATAVVMTKSIVDLAKKKSQDHFDAGFFCAESVLLAVTQHHHIESPLIPAIATGLSSGLSRTSNMCGALTGGILGLNLVYGRDRPEETVEQNYAAVQKLIEEFEQRCGSTQCSDLLGCHLGSTEGQKEFKEKGLWQRCRGFTGIATELAIKISDQS